MKKSMHLQEAKAESIFTTTLLVTYLLRDKKKGRHWAPDHRVIFVVNCMLHILMTTAASLSH